MYLDNNDFVLWMEKLSKKLTDISRDLKLVINTNDAFVNEDKLLDNQDLAFLLKVSYRTLQQEYTRLKYRKLTGSEQGVGNDLETTETHYSALIFIDSNSSFTNKDIQLIENKNDFHFL